MNEEKEIILHVTLTSIAVTIVGFIIYRIVKAQWSHVKQAIRSTIYTLKMFLINYLAHTRVHTKAYQIALCRIGLYCATAMMFLPTFGYYYYMKDNDITFSITFYLQILSPQVIGPAFLFMLNASSLFIVIHHKRVLKMLPILTVLSACFTYISSGTVSHEFSHFFLDACVGYMDFIFYPVLTLTLAQIAVYFLDHRAQQVAFCDEQGMPQ